MKCCAPASTGACIYMLRITMHALTAKHNRAMRQFQTQPVLNTIFNLVLPTSYRSPAHRQIASLCRFLSTHLLSSRRSLVTAGLLLFLVFALSPPTNRIRSYFGRRGYHERTLRIQGRGRSGNQWADALRFGDTVISLVSATPGGLPRIQCPGFLPPPGSSRMPPHHVYRLSEGFLTCRSA